MLTCGLRMQVTLSSWLVAKHTIFRTQQVACVCVPSEGTANAQVQLLTCVHRQSLIAVGFPQLVHGVADVQVCDGAEFCTIHCAFIAI